MDSYYYPNLVQSTLGRQSLIYIVVCFYIGGASMFKTVPARQIQETL